MLKYELVKIFIKKHFIFVAAAFMLFEAISGFALVGNLFQTNSEKDKYTELIYTYEGEINEAKKTQLENLNERYSSAEGEREGLRERLEAGEISKEEYEIETEIVKEYLSGKDTFFRFYEQCEYAFEDQTNRHIVNAEFWNVVFGNEKLDFVYIVSVIIITLLTVISENESSFSEIKNTCKNGRTKLHILDNSICITYAVLSSLLLSAARFITAALYFGNTSLNSPIQSLPLFENSRFNLTLFQLFLLVSALKMLGGAAFSALSVTAGYFFKSSFSVLLFDLFAAVIPPYVLSSPILYYVSPISLLISNGFFFGDVSVSGDDVGGTIVYSVSVSTLALVLSIGIAVCLIVLSYKFNRRRLS